jgi:HEAT repeat protein
MTMAGAIVFLLAVTANEDRIAGALQQLRSKDPVARARSVRTLGTLEDPRAVAALVQAASDADAGVRLAAVQALHGPLTLAGTDARAADALAHALGDVDPDVRAAAADSLDTSNLAARRALPALVKALGDSSPDVRRAVLGALGSIGDSTAFAPVAAVLEGPDADLKPAAAEALGVLQDKRGVEPLVKAVVDSDERLRAAAVSALGALEDSRGLAPLLAALKTDPVPRVRARAAKGLGRAAWGEPVVAPLKAAACGDREAVVRTAAITALGRIGSAPAAAALRCGLRDADTHVRDAAREALESLGNEERP